MRLPLAIVGTLLLFFVFIGPQPAAAHRLGCHWLARDASTEGPFNFVWVTAIICTDDTNALKLSPHLQYYDWNGGQWVDLQDLPHTSAIDEDMVAAYGVLTIPPYLGVNCRRVRLYIVTVDAHPDENPDEYVVFDNVVYSSGECY